MIYSQANRDAPTADIVRVLVEARVGRDWCLFLDRDGVISRRIVGDYVRGWDQFEWLPGALSALRILRAWAPRIVVATNQQGIGKGLMSCDAVADIHRRLDAAVRGDRGRGIDAFQVCPHLESMKCGCRKPHPGLVLEWLEAHPTIDASLSIMVGDSTSDMELARNVATRTGGCVGVSIACSAEPVGGDVSFKNLAALAAVVDSVQRREQP